MKPTRPSPALPVDGLVVRPGELYQGGAGMDVPMWANIETGSRWADDMLRAWVVIDQVMLAETIYVQLRRHRGRSLREVESDTFLKEFTRILPCSSQKSSQS